MVRVVTGAPLPEEVDVVDVVEPDPVKVDNDEVVDMEDDVVEVEVEVEVELLENK